MLGGMESAISIHVQDKTKMRIRLCDVFITPVAQSVHCEMKIINIYGVPPRASKCH